MDEALARCRARWTHPPLDRRDVEERVALRYRDAAAPPLVTVLATPPACRIFRLLQDDEEPRRRRWTSCYVHRLEEVDQVLGLLEERAREAARRAA